jgi:hypothetical protein
MMIFTSWAVLTSSCLQKILTIRLSNSLRELLLVISNILWKMSRMIVTATASIATETSS